MIDVWIDLGQRVIAGKEYERVICFAQERDEDEIRRYGQDSFDINWYESEGEEIGMDTITFWELEPDVNEMFGKNQVMTVQEILDYEASYEETNSEGG